MLKMDNITINNFDQLFNLHKEEVFKKSANMIQPDNNEIIKIFNNEAKNIYNNFQYLKSDSYPEIPYNFLYYIRENLVIGPFNTNIHSPIFYTTQDGIESYKYASPEIIDRAWVDFKISKFWYEKLLEIGYYVKNQTENK